MHRYCLETELYHLILSLHCHLEFFLYGICLLYKHHWWANNDEVQETQIMTREVGMMWSWWDYWNDDEVEELLQRRAWLVGVVTEPGSVSAARPRLVRPLACKLGAIGRVYMAQPGSQGAAECGLVARTNARARPPTCILPPIACISRDAWILRFSRATLALASQPTGPSM
jgi:hypothetical protein